MSQVANTHFGNNMVTHVARFTSHLLPGALFASLGMLASLDVQARSGDQPRPVTISAMHGEVHVAARGADVKAAIGMTVNLPAVVRTGADGSIELRQGETIVSAASNAALEIPVSADPAETLDRIIQSRGNVYYSVAKRTSSKLHVETRYLVAVIKGTQFNVSVTDSASTLSLLEGLIELRSPDGADVAQISAGQVGVMSADQPRIRVLSLTSGEVVRGPAPSLASRGIDSAGAPASAGASMTANGTQGSAAGSSATVPGLTVAASASAGSAAGSGLMVSNVARGNSGGAAGNSGGDVVGALQSLAARTNANANSGNGNSNSSNGNSSNSNSNSGSGNSSNSNSNSGSGNSSNSNSNSGSTNSGNGNSGNGNSNSGSNSGNNSVTDLVQNLQNLANNGSTNSNSGKGKSKAP
jgi:hypothetical protein